MNLLKLAIATLIMVSFSHAATDTKEANATQKTGATKEANVTKEASATKEVNVAKEASTPKETNATKTQSADTNKTATKQMKRPAYLDMDDLNLTSIDGKSLHVLSTKKGFTFDSGKDKITLVAVWAQACKSCPGWLKDLNELQKKYPKKLNIVALEINNMPIDKLKEFTKKNALTYTMLSADQNKDFAAQTLIKYQFSTKHKQGLPFTVVLGYQGQTNAVTVGVAKKKEYSDYIAKLIKFYEEE